MVELPRSVRDVRRRAQNFLDDVEFRPAVRLYREGRGPETLHVNDCRVRLDSQAVLRLIATEFCKVHSNTVAAVAMMSETKIMKTPITLPRQCHRYPVY